MTASTVVLLGICLNVLRCIFEVFIIVEALMMFVGFGMISQQGVGLDFAKPDTQAQHNQ